MFIESDYQRLARSPCRKKQKYHEYIQPQRSIIL